MTLHYRLARASDAAPVAALVQRSYAHYVPVIGLRPAPMDADYDGVVERQPVWVAEGDDGRLVGAIVLSVASDHLGIDNVAVSPEEQGTGVGSHLLDLAEDEAGALGLDEVRLFTHELMTANIAYYGRRGYVETHRVDEGGFHRVFFTKSLADAPAAGSRPPVEGRTGDQPPRS